jgi:ketosteroid isomerase-like protein
MQEVKMTVSVPPMISAYFAATNAHDPDAAVASFAEMAVVVDERHEYVGKPAIRGWLVAVFAKYGVTSTVSAITHQGDTHRVAALVSGNFPGRPATLHYDFTLADDGIARLSIG